MDRRGNGGGGEGGAGGMRTVECLRGRLLAERVASKAAKEEADQLAARVPYHFSSTHIPYPCVNSFNSHYWFGTALILFFDSVTVGRA